MRKRIGSIQPQKIATQVGELSMNSKSALKPGGSHILSSTMAKTKEERDFYPLDCSIDQSRKEPGTE